LKVRKNQTSSVKAAGGTQQVAGCKWCLRRLTAGGCKWWLVVAFLDLLD